MNTTPTWQKSCYSGQQSNCVELTTTLDGVRDSKDREGSRLNVDVRPLIRAVKNNRFDR